MSSSNSSSSPDQKSKTIVVAMEEKRTMNSPKLSSLEEVVFENTIPTERPSFGLGVVRTETNMMKKYPPRNAAVVMCNICNKIFPNAKSLGGHQSIHTQDKELERQLKNLKPSSFPKPYNSYQDKSSFLFGENSQDALTFGGISFGPFKSTGGGGNIIRRTTFPPSNNRFMASTSHGFASGTLSLTHNYNLYPKLSDILQGNSSDYPPLFERGFYRSFTDINMPMFPPAKNPYNENTIYGSSSRDPLPLSYSYGPHVLSLDLSLGLPNPIGSSINNNNNSGSHGFSLLDVPPPPSPSRSTGDSSNNSSGVIGGGIMTDLNMPLWPSVVDSATRNDPPPPPATNLSNDENVPGSSNSEKLISKGKNEICLFGIKITNEVAEDHDED